MKKLASISNYKPQQQPVSQQQQRPAAFADTALRSFGNAVGEVESQGRYQKFRNAFNSPRAPEGQWSHLGIDSGDNTLPQEWDRRTIASTPVVNNEPPDATGMDLRGYTTYDDGKSNQSPKGMPGVNFGNHQSYEQLTRQQEDERIQQGIAESAARRSNSINTYAQRPGY
jgi:hypothetical protein